MSLETLNSDDAAARRLQMLDLIAVLVLSSTTILTAWSAFEAAKWGGAQAVNSAAAGATRNESVRASNQASSEVVVDVTTFTAWADAVATEQEQLASFYFDRFRDEFKPAVEAWLATNPLTSADAPSTPFEMGEYRLESAVRSAQLLEEAEALTADARDDNQRSDNYIAMAILFAGVLFFGGISTKLETLLARSLLVGLAVVGLGAGVIMLLTFPVEI